MLFDLAKDKNSEFWKDNFSHYRVPMALFKEEPYKKMSISAKLIYGILLSNVRLSEGRKYIDDNGTYYTKFTNAMIQQYLGCSHGTATKVLKELEEHGLIRVRHMFAAPSHIYVLPFRRAKD